MKPFVITRRVEFYDTDLAGIVHFANYYRFMEQAEHELFRTYGLKITGHLPDGTKFGWPRVAAACKYSSPAFYDDLLEIHVRIVRRTERALHTAYEFRRGEQRLAEGEMTTVFCVFPNGERMQSAAMPADIAARLDAALADQSA
uniref:Acyl-CoA thioesterase n=1 Tax=Schlesneria paludicola TaxID=360056 RepID=A0A7C4QNZ0_9PLAN